MTDNSSAFNSDKYDEKILRTIPHYDDIYKQITDFVKCYKPNHSLDWLDVGCGTGKMANCVLNVFSINKFIFCDCSDEMIKFSKNKFNLPYTDFIVLKSQNLNFTNEFDVVTAVFVHHYLKYSEKIIAVKRCYDALRENGIFITFDNFAPNSSIMKKLYLKRWKNYQLSQGKNEKECDEHISRYNENYFPITVSDHMELLKRCGFKNAEILWLSYMQAGIVGIK